MQPEIVTSPQGHRFTITGRQHADGHFDFVATTPEGEVICQWDYPGFLSMMNAEVGRAVDQAYADGWRPKMMTFAGHGERDAWVEWLANGEDLKEAQGGDN